MKKFLVFAMCALFMSSVVSAQTDYKEIRKQRMELRKMTKSDLNARASKDARKDAKKKQKEGWQNFMGTLPIEKQLDRSFNMQYEFDDNLFPKYVMATTEVTGETLAAAQDHAQALAIAQIARQVQTEVSMLTEGSIANKSISDEEAASINKATSAIEAFVERRKISVMPVCQFFRKTKNGLYNVSITYATNGDLAKKLAKEAMHMNLEQEGKDLHEKLDEMLGK